MAYIVHDSNSYFIGDSVADSSQVRYVAAKVIKENPSVQAVLYIGSEIYLYRDASQGAKTVGKTNPGLIDHIENDKIPLGPLGDDSNTLGSGSYAQVAFASTALEFVIDFMVPIQLIKAPCRIFDVDSRRMNMDQDNKKRVKYG
jgi:hypothetical protein